MVPVRFSSPHRSFPPFLSPSSPLSANSFFSFYPLLGQRHCVGCKWNSIYPPPRSARLFRTFFFCFHVHLPLAPVWPCPFAGIRRNGDFGSSLWKFVLMDQAPRSIILHCCSSSRWLLFYSVIFLKKYYIISKYDFSPLIEL